MRSPDASDGKKGDWMNGEKQPFYSYFFERNRKSNDYMWLNCAESWQAQFKGLDILLQD